MKHAKSIMDARNLLIEGVDGIDGIGLVAKDVEMSGLAIRSTSNKVNILIVADLMEEYGWKIERQQLPDAQVAALLAAAEQYRKGVGGGLGTGQGIRQELVAEAMRAYDMARDVRLMQARGGATRPLQQAAYVQQLIVGTYKQARKWEEAAVAQLLLTDLRDGRIPQVEAEAADEEAMESPASGGGSPAVGSPAGRTATSSFAAKFADVAAKFGAVDK